MEAEALWALGKEVIACSGFHWMKGMTMIDEDGERAVVALKQDSGLWLAWIFREDGWDQLDTRAAVPALDDPATLGCLMALVREAWNEPEASSTAGAGYDGFWGWWAFAGGKQFEGATEAEALVAAFKAAPAKEKK